MHFWTWIESSSWFSSLKTFCIVIPQNIKKHLDWKRMMYAAFIFPDPLKDDNLCKL